MVDCKQALHKLLEEYPDYGPAHRLLAKLYHYELKDLSQAERHYMLSLNYESDRPFIYWRYLELLMSGNRFDEAERLLQRMEAVKSMNRTELIYRRGIILESRGKLSEAMALYRQAFTTSITDDEGGLYLKAIWRIRSKQIEKHPLRLFMRWRK